MGQQLNLWEHKETGGEQDRELSLKDKEWSGLREEGGKCDMSNKEAFQEGSCLSNNATEKHIQAISVKYSLDIAVSLRGKYKTKWKRCYSAL